MSSIVEICNVALARVGAERISSLQVASTAARYCELLYPIERDAVLEGYDWGFARKRVALPLLDEMYSGWNYAYGYPTDCIIPRLIQSDITGSVIKFEVSTDSGLDKRVILTDQVNAELLYSAAITNSNLFSSKFIDALSWRLASSLATSLRADLTLSNSLMQQYFFSLNIAQRNDANISHGKPANSNPFIEARL